MDNIRMETCSSFSIQKSSRKAGFAIAEVVIALILVTMAVSLVGGLGQQVLNLARRSKQTAAVIEIRSKVNAVTQNTSSWIAKLRSSPDTGQIISACLPDSSAISSIYDCPAVRSDLLDADPELKKIAGSQLHASSIPLVDMMGEKFAGTLDEPVFYDLEGRLCERDCAFKVSGILLRTNPDTSSNPGNLRFVVKVQPHLYTQGSLPMKTQYLTVDVGSQWQEPVGLCPSGSIKVGYFSNGKPSCINPTKKCAAGTLHIGLDSSGEALCKAPPSNCSSSGSSVVLNNSGTDLECSTQNNAAVCGSGEIFLGFYAGTGVPMCSGTNLSCPTGQVQIGIKQVGSSLTAQCKALPSCLDSQKLSYDGSQFVCQSSTVASACSSGHVVVGINEDGSVKCDLLERAPASEDPVAVHPSVKEVSSDAGYRLIRLDANRIMIESFGDKLRFKMINGKIYEATVKTITVDLSSSSSGVSDVSNSWFYLYLSLKGDLGLRLRASTLSPLQENVNQLKTELGEYKYLGSVYNDSSGSLLPFTQSGNSFVFHAVQHQKPLASQKPASGGLWQAWPGAVSKTKINLDFVPQTATFAKVQHFVQNGRNSPCGWTTVFYVDENSSAFQSFTVPSGDGTIANVTFDIPLKAQSQMGFYYESVAHCTGVTAEGQIISITGWVDGYLE